MAAGTRFWALKLLDLMCFPLLKAIIYITEVLAKDMAEEIDKYKDSRLPAIISIPGKEGATGEGMRSVSKAVERAVGADILFGGEK